MNTIQKKVRLSKRTESTMRTASNAHAFRNHTPSYAAEFIQKRAMLLNFDCGNVFGLNFGLPRLRTAKYANSEHTIDNQKNENMLRGSEDKSNPKEKHDKTKLKKVSFRTGIVRLLNYFPFL